MTVITRMSSFSTLNGAGRGKVSFGYDTAAPHAVSVVFLDVADEPVEWEFARDVLARNVSGVGDVRCDVDGMWTILHLSSDEGNISLRIVRAQVDAFLAETVRAVPYGSESIDFDAELDQLLKDGAR